VTKAHSRSYPVRPSVEKCFKRAMEDETSTKDDDLGVVSLASQLKPVQLFVDEPRRTSSRGTSKMLEVAGAKSPKKTSRLVSKCWEDTHLCEDGYCFELRSFIDPGSECLGDQLNSETFEDK
jgi:hypothetical protein